MIPDITYAPSPFTPSHVWLSCQNRNPPIALIIFEIFNLNRNSERIPCSLLRGASMISLTKNVGPSFDRRALRKPRPGGRRQGELYKTVRFPFPGAKHCRKE
jgi:hypothetical protein